MKSSPFQSLKTSNKPLKLQKISRRSKTLIEKFEFFSKSPSPKRKFFKNLENIKREFSQTPLIQSPKKEKNFESFNNSFKNISKTYEKSLKTAKFSLRKKCTLIEPTKKKPDPEKKCKGKNENFSNNIEENRWGSMGKSKNCMPFLLIKTEMEKKNWENALELLENVTVSASCNAEYQYFRGLCNLNLKKYEEASQDFLILKENKKNITPQLLVALYQCFYCLNNIKSALKTLNLAISYFPSYLPSYFFRGQLQLLLKNYEIAIKDLKFSKYSEAYYYISECWKNKGNYEKALKYLLIAKEIFGSNVKIWLDIGKLDYRFGKIESAKKEFERIVKVFEKNQKNDIDPEDFRETRVSIERNDKGLAMTGPISVKSKNKAKTGSQIEGEFMQNDSNFAEAIYYLAKCKEKLNEKEEAELLYEKILSHFNFVRIFNRSVFRIGAIKMEKNDFYAACFAFNRRKVEFHSSRKANLVKFSESVYQILKGHFDESVLLLTNLLENAVSNELIYKYFIFRAYAYFSMQKYGNSINDYEKAEKYSEIDTFSKLNYTVSKAIIEYSEKNYEKCLKITNSPLFQCSQNYMCQIIKSFAMIQCISLNNLDFSPVWRVINEINTIKKDHLVLFLQALLCYFDKKYEECLEFICKSIEIAEKNFSYTYTLRGFCFISLKNFSEAYEDLSLSLKIEKNAEIPKFRGICAYFCGINTDLIEDLVEDSEFPSKLSISLLIFVQKYSEALKILEKSVPSLENLTFKAICYLLTYNFDKCLSILNTVYSPELENDAIIIENLSKNRFKANNIGSIFKKKYFLWIKALQKLYKSKFSEAKALFEEIFSMLHADTGLFFSENIIYDEESCEILYNISICGIFINTQESLIEARQILQEISYIMQDSHLGQISLLCGVISLNLHEKEIACKYLEDAARFSPEACAKFVKCLETLITPLYTGNDFSLKFEELRFPDFSFIKFRPAIRLPQIEPQIFIEDTVKIMLNLMNYKIITPKPEAPWLKKIGEKYQFTEELLDDVETSEAYLKKGVDLKKLKNSQNHQGKSSEIFKKKFIEIDIFDKIRKICN